MQVIYDLKSPSFGEKQISNLHHHVIISKNEIKSSFFSPFDNFFHAFKSFRFNSELNFRIVNEFIINNFEFNTKPLLRKISFSNQRFCLLPTFLKDDHARVNAFEFSFKKQDGEILKHQILSELDSQLIFGLNPVQIKIANLLEVQDFSHFAFNYLRSILARKFYSDSNELFIDIDQHFILAIIIKNGNLQLINTYSYRTNEDILYHFLNLSKIFGLDTNKDTYFISGNYFKGAKLHTLLQNYIRYLFTIKLDDKVSPTLSIEPNLLQQFFSLMIM
jgi:hypothetical protein